MDFELKTLTLRELRALLNSCIWSLMARNDNSSPMIKGIEFFATTLGDYLKLEDPKFPDFFFTSKQ